MSNACPRDARLLQGFSWRHKWCGPATTSGAAALIRNAAGVGQHSWSTPRWNAPIPRSGSDSSWARPASGRTGSPRSWASLLGINGGPLPKNSQSSVTRPPLSYQWSVGVPMPCQVSTRACTRVKSATFSRLRNGLGRRGDNRVPCGNHLYYHRHLANRLQGDSQLH